MFRLFRFYTETESFDVSIEPKQTEDQRKQFDREHILVFFRKFRVLWFASVLFWNSSVCFSCFDIGSKHLKKTEANRFFFGFTKQTETLPKQILFQFETNFFLFWGHPSSDIQSSHIPISHSTRYNCQCTSLNSRNRAKLFLFSMWKSWPDLTPASGGGGG